MEKVRRNFFGINYPEVYGGLNLDLFYTVIFLEELQKIKSSGFSCYVGTFLFSHDTLKCRRRRKIKQDYLVPSIAGDVGALCITEPYGGSDVAGMRTTAVRINMLMDQNIYYEWCLCGLLYCCHKTKEI
jgi:alkylation response protein AidB-like acyl-CoA dehydrogenase